ncbi:hypothetical protein C5167_000854 [Papaver somniferum]|uniref:Transcription initiation factor IIF subunit alpha n=1 Tax=Papaver somniferum TaxID=3469 RepID=A0A4Y7KXQ3_PAPSO|nr:transcription initiation factor IIF subunit alpha-like [Papaver somniferum]RZC76729.1 hypothetical protein C5167_000854 [Papaver somniferum]
MSFDLQLKPSCGGCGSTSDLYGSNCKHMTLCYSCGKRMTQNRAKCFNCGTQITRLIREYNVRACSTSEKNYFVGRFVSGVPVFSKKKNADNRWALRKQGLVGRQVTDTLREKFKNKPWLLEDETGQFQYHGHLEGAQCASYYLLMMQGKEFVAIPAGSWYNFNKVAQYRQLTLEEAEEKIKKRRNASVGYERWMMKIANSGAAAFGEKEKDEKEAQAGGSRGGRKKENDDEDEGNVSDKGDEDEEEEAQRKNRLRLNKRDGDDDEEGPSGGDLDMDDDDVEKGDDWEHEEIFTDDDEAVGNDPEEREDLAPEVPAPPEIKQDDDDDDDDDEANEVEGGGLSKSGKELKKLLGRSAGMNDSDAKADNDDDDEADDDMSMSSALAPKKKDTPKEEPVETPAKAAPSGSTRGTKSTTSKSTKSNKRSSGDDGKVANSAPLKKVKTEMESKSSAIEGSASALSSAKASADPSPGCVTEEEIRAILVQSAPLTTRELVAKFDGRLNSKEEKDAFGAILKQIAIVKRMDKFDGAIYVVLKDK